MGKKKVTVEMRKCFELNDNENTTNQTTEIQLKLSLEKKNYRFN